MIRLKKTGKQGTVFIDFDGTLIDNQIRQFLVYEKIAESLKLDKILKRKLYWQIRRTGVSFAALFEKEHGLSKTQSIKNKYIQLIEKSNLLEKDVLIRNAKTVLGKLSKKYNLVLVSLRRKKNNFFKQLKDLGINDFFDEVNVSASGKDSVKTKQLLIKQSKYYVKNKRYLIGDTEIDVQAGQDTGCLVIAVCSGIRNAEFLKAYAPDHLIKNISDIENIIRV